MDIAHWEFIGLLFGLALASIEMSGWKMKVLRHAIGIIGVLLAGTCIVLLFGFSGATLRSPITLHWPVVLPSDKPIAQPAPVSIVRSQVSPAATPTPAYLAELAALKDDNAKLKSDNARLKRLNKQQPRTIAVMASPVPSACPSVTLPSVEKMATQDCGELMRAQPLIAEEMNQQIAAQANQ